MEQNRTNIKNYGDVSESVALVIHATNAAIHKLLYEQYFLKGMPKLP